LSCSEAAKQTDLASIKIVAKSIESGDRTAPGTFEHGSSGKGPAPLVTRADHLVIA